MSGEEIVFFRPGFIQSPELKLEGEEISHLKAFRIFSENKIVIIKDGNGNNIFYEVSASSKSGSFIRAEKKEKPSYEACIATAVPKGNRLEWLIQKGTELGITRFRFLIFAHSDRKDLNVERLLKVAGEACSQSKQDFLPEILAPVVLEKFLQSYPKPNKELIVLDPEADLRLDVDLILGKTVIIGPEGGFRPEELEMIRKYSVQGTTLGKSILRIETAGLYAASLFRLGNSF